MIRNRCVRGTVHVRCLGDREDRLRRVLGQWMYIDRWILGLHLEGGREDIKLFGGREEDAEDRWTFQIGNEIGLVETGRNLQLGQRHL